MPSRDGQPSILDNLDHQQRAAVLHRDGPGLIVAGAGAGKTTVLVRRTAYLVQGGVHPSSILLLTFTRASAKSILDRAAAYVPGASGFFGGTFHSVAARIIRENHRLFGLPEGFTVLDPGDVDDTLKRIMGQNPAPKMAPRSGTFNKVISFARNTQRSIADTIRLSQFIQHTDLVAHFELIDREYRAYKRKLHVLDFDDLLELWARLMEHPSYGEQMRERFRYVMVDEHQDSNALQLRIIYGLGGPNGNVMAVGDPSQSIYGFRGAAPGTMFDFHRQWPATKTYLIETNYRSTPEIVGMADKVDRSLVERFDRTLVAAKPSAGIRPALVHTMDADSEADWIVNRVLELREEGIALSKQAIIVRSMRRARNVEVKLTAAGIPLRMAGGIKLHEAAHIKDLISVLRIITNPADEPAWLRFLCLLRGIGEKTALKYTSSLVETGSIDKALLQLQDLALAKKELAVALPILRAAERHARSAMNALDAVRKAMWPLLEERWGDEWEWRVRDVDDVINLAATQGTTEEFLRTITIDVAIDKRSEANRARQADEAPITISTIHAAKGLEWDVVFIPSFVSGHLPSQFSEVGEGDEEEKRLLYVAVTRAKKDLILVRPATLIVKGEPAIIRESYFEPLLRPHLEIQHAQAQTNARSLTIEPGSDVIPW